MAWKEREVEEIEPYVKLSDEFEQAQPLMTEAELRMLAEQDASNIAREISELKSGETYRHKFLPKQIFLMLSQNMIEFRLTNGLSMADFTPRWDELSVYNDDSQETELRITRK